MAPEERIVWDAEFNDAVTTYWLVNGAIICLVTVVGIPLLPVWYFVGKWFTRKYLKSHKCTLTNRTLKVAKGVLVKTEKTVPLDRITDLGILQGPIMRFFEIEALSVETAGQSSAGSLIHLAGIKDGRQFRDAVLKQRDLVVGSVEDAIPKTHAPVSAELGDPEAIHLLTQIRDALVRIEENQQ